MKDYPSISASTGQKFEEFDAYVFDKPDGSNLRAEFTSKRGFCKFGTRSRLFDETDQIFGGAIKIFNEIWNEPISKLVKDEHWDGVTIFCEFVGPNSFAGQHALEDPKSLIMFDVCPLKKGFLGPKDFLKLCGDFEHTVRYRGQERWTRAFVQSVREGKFECSEEGVVGKMGSAHKIIRAKAKTQLWIDKVTGNFDAETAATIIDS